MKINNKILKIQKINCLNFSIIVMITYNKKKKILMIQKRKRKIKKNYYKLFKRKYKAKYKKFLNKFNCLSQDFNKFKLN